MMDGKEQTQVIPPGRELETDQPVHILLVEDDEDDFVLIQDYLRDFRWARPVLEWVDNYGAALECIWENRHDVYLIDYYLGDHTGLELLQAAWEDGSRGPFIMLTGQGARDVDLAAMAAGAVDYLTKANLEPENLERAIRYAVHRRRVEQELAELQRRLLDSREEERAALARELHDGPLQLLLGAHMHLGVLRSQLTGEQRDHLESILHTLQEVSDSLRQLTGELRPPALSSFGLDKAIRSYIQSFQRRHPHIQVTLRLANENRPLAHETRIALYRIFQNALSNVAQHAEADQVQVDLSFRQNRVRLRIEDNGRGFQLPSSWLQLARHGHYGLVGSVERAEAIGGRLMVRSAPGQGTAVLVVAPLSPAPGSAGSESDNKRESQ
ncbi:response regulator [Litorilinea aerophila]|nr:response regulator [Litorilinea aerophila]